MILCHSLSTLIFFFTQSRNMQQHLSSCNQSEVRIDCHFSTVLNCVLVPLLCRIWVTRKTFYFMHLLWIIRFFCQTQLQRAVTLHASPHIWGRLRDLGCFVGHKAYLYTDVLMRKPMSQSICTSTHFSLFVFSSSPPPPPPLFRCANTHKVLPFIDQILFTGFHK